MFAIHSHKYRLNQPNFLEIKPELMRSLRYSTQQIMGDNERLMKAFGNFYLNMFKGQQTLLKNLKVSPLKNK